MLYLLFWRGIQQSQCGQYPVLDIGNDTMLCQGASITYPLPAGYDSYNWNIGTGNQPSVTITSPTTLILNIKELDVTIVNRWENPVYTSSAVPFGWDGKDASENLVNEGIYFYKYSAKGVQDESFEG